MLYRSDVQIGVTQDPVALAMAIPVPFPLDPFFCRCCQNLSLQLFAGASLFDVSGSIVHPTDATLMVVIGIQTVIGVTISSAYAEETHIR